MDTAEIDKNVNVIEIGPGIGALTEFLAENAAENQVKFMLNTKVCDIVHDGRIQAVVTSRGVIETKYVINAAGVYADDISRMAGDVSYTIHPRKGTIVLLDQAKTYPKHGALALVLAQSL